MRCNAAARRSSARTTPPMETAAPAVPAAWDRLCPGHRRPGAHRRRKVPPAPHAARRTRRVIAPLEETGKVEYPSRGRGMSNEARSMVIVMLLAATAAYAQAPNAPPDVLAKATGLKCTFSAFSTGDWKNGVAEGAVKPSNLSVSFIAIDTQDGTAEAVGDSGKSHITV